MAAAGTSSAQPERFARTSRYIASLPGGLDAFPECRAKASVHRTVARVHGAKLEGLPAALQAEMDTPSSQASWISQAHTLAMIIAMVETAPEVLDAIAAGQDRTRAEPAWIRKAASALFDTPMYRILMWTASPRLLFKGANIRWSAFFRGSRLEGTVTSDHTARVDLFAPPGLFNDDLARIFEHVLTAAVSFTQTSGDHAHVVLEDVTDERIRYRGRW